MLNGEALNLMEQTNQVRGGQELGWERRVDRKDGWLRELKETLVKKDNQNMERAYEGDGWITILAIYQYRTYLSREEFRDAKMIPLEY